MKFSELGLHPHIIDAVAKLGYESCTDIQEQAIPPVLSGKDMAGLAQTGTGKTAAFLIPLMDRLLRSKFIPENLSDEEKELYAKRAFPEWKASNFILVLVPTRELADQVAQEIDKLRGPSNVPYATIYGGTGYDKQIEAIKGGVDFIVGTPGRLIDLYKSHSVDFKQVRAIVFDEADRMFDMGFRDDMTYILRRVPKERQFLVFSATLNFEVLNTAYMFGADPVECNVSRDQAKAENVKDEIFHVGQPDKPQLLLSVLKRENPKQVIVFSNFKHNVERISRFLSMNQYSAVGISSLLTQNQRNRVMEQFKTGVERSILVATDVAARGLDIKGVDMVINYELPDDPENYVHRIGRTGRAGETGKAYSLVSDRDVDALTRIEDYLKHKLPVSWMEEADLAQNIVPFSEADDRPKPAFQGRPKPGHSRGPRRDRPPGDRPRHHGHNEDRNREPRQGETRREEGRRERHPEHRTEHRSEGRPDTSDRQHRDRALGRHQGASGSDPQSPRGDSRHPRRHDNRHDSRPDNRQANRHGGSHENRSTQGRHRNDHRKPRPNGHSPQHHTQLQRRPLKHAKKDSGIASKVSGFIKNLFGFSKSKES